MPFRLAINMAGAVSAGAYTAGVLDFLVEALDAWYDTRDRQRGVHGDDIQAWTVPAHDVTVDAMTGASAGGMCAAISSVALREVFDHVKSAHPPADQPVNRLYQSWVRSIDIIPLLGMEDLSSGDGSVKSLLDSSPIDRIAVTALTPDPARLKVRPWVAEEMGIILTLSNLRGIPYSVDKADLGSFEERINFHADRIEFAMAARNAADTPTSRALNYSNPANENWQVLRNSAMATGAFPVMLASRTLERKRNEYEERLWKISNVNPNERQECQGLVTIPPAWEQASVPEAFQNVYADGGVTNNNPFECAREYLVSKAGNPNGHNPREPEKANAAVISVAPFPGDQPFNSAYDAQKQSELLPVLSALIGTLVSQSRFQGEDLKLTADEDVSSRFAIAPSDDTAGKRPALLGGALGAFGGFIDQNFRERDYQLGRRNCQQFLRKYLVLPENNATIAEGVAKKPEILEAFRSEYGTLIQGTWWYPVIPLMPALRPEIVAPPRDQFKTTPERLTRVAAAATDRLKAVLRALVDTPGGGHGPWSFVVSAIFDLGGASKVKNVILQQLLAQLGALEQV